MTQTPPNGLSACEAIGKIRDGWISCVDLATACLEQIDLTDGQLHAWVHVERESVLANAEALDEIRRQGKPMGRLHGIPVGLKDIIDTKDNPTQRGSSIFDGRQPTSDARIVQRLKEEGALLLGKTATTELAFVHPCATRNPHNPEHTPGGSSSGSAAAVAGFHAPLSIGTQTNGSVIRPASYCGTYGFKPSRGIIPRTGVLQTSKTLDQIGVFGRSLEDVALLADVLGCYDPADEKSYARPRPAMVDLMHSELPTDPDIVWLELPYSDRFSDDCRVGLEEVVNALDDRVEKIKAPEYFADLPEMQRIIHEFEISMHLSETFEGHWDQISDTLKPVIERARLISSDEYQHALGVMEQVEEFFGQFFLDFDAILTASATGEAPLASKGGTGDPICSTIWTLAGLPCLSLPILVSGNGLPIGVQLVGNQEEDGRLLRTAKWMLTQIS